MKARLADLARRFRGERPRCCRRASRGDRPSPAGGRTRARRRQRLNVAGAGLGLVVGAIAFAPATVAGPCRCVGERARGVARRRAARSGRAARSRCSPVDRAAATRRPSRPHLEWSLALAGAAFELRLTQPCCLNGTVARCFKPGLSRWTATLVTPPGGLGSGRRPGCRTWARRGTRCSSAGPCAWCRRGSASSGSPGAGASTASRGRDLDNASSRLSTLRSHWADGSTRLAGNPANAGRPQLPVPRLSPAHCSLQRQRQPGPGGMRFRGEARAGDGAEQALANLLNIIGQRRRAPVYRWDEATS